MDDYGLLENYDSDSKPETVIISDLVGALKSIRDLIDTCGHEVCGDEELYDIFYNVIPVIIDDVLPRPEPLSDDIPF